MILAILRQDVGPPRQVTITPDLVSLNQGHGVLGFVISDKYTDNKKIGFVFSRTLSSKNLRQLIKENIPVMRIRSLVLFRNNLFTFIIGDQEIIFSVHELLLIGGEIGNFLRWFKNLKEKKRESLLRFLDFRSGIFSFSVYQACQRYKSVKGSGNSQGLQDLLLVYEQLISFLSGEGPIKTPIGTFYHTCSSFYFQYSGPDPDGQAFATYVCKNPLKIFGILWELNYSVAINLLQEFGTAVNEKLCNIVNTIDSIKGLNWEG